MAKRDVHHHLERERLEKLYATAALINSETELAEVLDRVLHAAAEIVGAQACSILMVDAAGNHLRFLAAIGLTADKVRQFVIPVHEGIAGWAFQHGEVTMVDDARRDPRFYSRIADTLAEPHKSIVAIPLKVKGRVVGVMEAIHFSAKMTFDADDVRFLEAFANQAALAIERARLCDRLSEQNRSLKGAFTVKFSFDDFLTRDPRMLAVIDTAKRVAATEASVLIQGESGTGKELLAHAIHGESPRSGGPFLVINSGAIPEQLLEAELFGYEKGAFTGATSRKLGKIELADGGTLFLDEVGELPLALQVKLLRVLQERSFERVGGAEPICVNVRIISATNKRLDEEVREKRFREDLFYRLNVVPLEIPPLRDRRGDVLPLAEHFVERYARQQNKTISGLTPAARTELLAHDWPGNIRELQNAIERAVVLATGPAIEALHLPARPTADGLPDDGRLLSLKEAQTRFKRDYLRRVLRHTEGNQSKAAELLGIQRTYLSQLIKELDLNSDV